MKTPSPLTILSLLAHRVIADNNNAAGNQWGPPRGPDSGQGPPWLPGTWGPPGTPGTPGNWGPPRWADGDWNWGSHGPKGGPPVFNHNECPNNFVAGAPGAPRWTLPYQAMLPIHFQNQDVNQYWEQMCPRDRNAGVLYHPASDNRGCCTWRATATQVNGNWACCPCGASCTGNVPPQGPQWTQGQPWPTQQGWAGWGPGGWGAPATVTVVSSQVTQWYPTPYVTNSNGKITTVYPTPAPGQPPWTTWSGPGYQTIGGAIVSTGLASVPYQYVPGTTIPGKTTVSPQWVQVTGTHTVPVSVCAAGNNGKQSCSMLKTTAVSCRVENGQQKCMTSTGPVVQTVNAAPTGLAGRGVVGAAIAGLAAAGAAII